MKVTSLEEKLDTLGYGFFIPIFFVASGMTLDVQAIVKDPLRLLIFFVLLLMVRGLPALLVYRRALPVRQRAEMTFITATTMPLLIALAEIGLSDGVMIPANAAAIVGAGVLSVLIFPSIFAAISRRGRDVSGVTGGVTSSSAAGEPVVVTEARVAGEVSEAEVSAAGKGNIAAAE